MRSRRAWLLAAAMVSVCSAPAVDIRPESFEKQKPDGSYTITAPRVSKAPKIDGELNDACWEKAAVIKSFWKAGSLEMAEDQTIALVTFDAENLYIAFACQDRQLTGGEFERDSNDIWKNDGVEVFLSPERNPDMERQFILGAKGGRWDGWKYSEKGRFGEEWNLNPDWTGAVKEQPWGYTAEICIPLTGLIDIKEYPVGRGVVWNIKLTREDFGGHKGCKTSSWTLIGGSTSDLYGGGKLVFEDRNLYANGGAEEGDGKGGVVGWQSRPAEGAALKITQVSEPKTEGKFAAKIEVKGAPNGYYSLWPGECVALKQPVETVYFLTADIRIECPDENGLYGVFRLRQADGTNANADKVNWPKINAGWQKVRLAQVVKAGESATPPDLHGSAAKDGVIYLDNVRLEIGEAEMLGEDGDSWCLTGNATGPLKTRNKKIAGSYTYNDAMTTAAMFPARSMHAQCDEPGWYAGQIPFDKGKLTDGYSMTYVGWPGLWVGNNGKDIVFDLGQDYQIDRVQLISGQAYMFPPSLYLKSPGELRYVLVTTKCDQVQFDREGYKEKLSNVRFDKVRQAARWVRIQVPHGHAYNVVGEVQIWGREIAKDKRPERRAYLQAGGATPVKDPSETPVVYRDIPPVFPLPREMKEQGKAFVLKDDMVIGYEPADSPRAKTTAEVLGEEMAQCYGLKLKVQPASAGDAAILVGEADKSPVTAKALAEAKQAITAKSPGAEGYVLITGGKRIIIAGCDSAGAFYGCQALLSLTRRNAQGAWEAPGVLIRDWPAVDYRSLQGRPVPTRDLVRTLARFRINYYEFHPRNIIKAAEVDQFAERYFVNLVPGMDPEAIVQQAAPELVERAPGEKLEDMGVGRRVSCPSNPKTWEIYFKYLDEWLPKLHTDRVQINFDERYQSGNGARWNVCELCRARNMTAPQLLADTINKIDKKLKQYNKKIVMLDTCFMPAHKLSYPGDPDPQWAKALDLIPKDIAFCIWHPKEVCELFKEKGFKQVMMPLDDKDWREFEFPGKYFSGMNYYMMDGIFKVSSALAESWITWNPDAIRPHDPKADEIITIYARQWAQLHEGVNMPSIYAAAGDYLPIDISKAANRERTDEKAFDGRGFADLGPNCDLRALKPGRKTLAGIPFEIIDEAKNNGKGLVMVHNPGFADKTLPESVAIETGDLKAASLIFLHCLENRPGQNYMRRTELAGYLFMIYADGTYSPHELKYGVNTANWDGLPTHWAYSAQGQAMKSGQMVWSGQTLSGLDAYLYSSEWVNPKPDQPIKKILFRSAYSRSAMNPMLFAVTAVKADPALARPNTNAIIKLASGLEPARPVGRAVDLRGGKDESEKKYIAPDGTIIEAAEVENTYSDKAVIGGEDFRTWVGIANYDGNEFVRITYGKGMLTYTFPAPRALTGLTVTGAYRTERKTEDFPPTRCKFTVETDDGQGWKQVAGIGPVSPEETGPQWFPLPATSVQKLRVSYNMLEGMNRGGFSNITLYEPAK